MYRITTTDGFILARASTRKLAQARAAQQARQLGETILIQRRDQDGLYEEIAQVPAQG